MLDNPVVKAALKKTNLTHGVGDYDVDKLIALGYYKVNNGLHEEALTLFGDMLIKEPKLVGALLGRGTAFALTGKFLEAEADFTRAIAVDPKLGDSYKRRAQVFGATGRGVEAVADLTMAIKCDSNDSDAYYERANVLFKFKDCFRANLDIEQAIQMNPTKQSYLSLRDAIREALDDA